MQNYFLVKNTIIVYLFSFYVGSTILGQHFNCTKPFRKDSINRVVCLSWENRALILPQSIPTNIQGLHIFSFAHGTLMIDDVDTFKRFSNLIVLQMILRNGIETTSEFFSADQQIRLRNELFNVSSLEHLDISYLEFNSKSDSWVLPSSLKTLFVSNTVFDYDLSKCSTLEMLQLPGNRLRKIPKLSNPPPPLVLLNLSRNPLRDFVVNDMAEFCDLKVLGLDHTNISYCECFRLINWIRKDMKETEDFVLAGSLECDYVEDQDCSKYTLQEAESLRQMCYPVSGVIVWIVGFIALVAIVVLACFLIVYKLHGMRVLSKTGEE